MTDPPTESAGPGDPRVESAKGAGRRDRRSSPTPVLFLHSLGGDSSHWRRQIEHLEPSRLAVAVDLPGHGVSDVSPDGDYSVAATAAEISRLIDRLDLGPVALVGHSFGSWVAVALLQMRPEDIAGALLVDPGPDLRGEPAEAMAGFIEALEGASYSSTIEGHYRLALGGAEPQVSTAVLEGLTATPQEVVVSAFRSLLDFDLVTPLESYAGPVLSVIGDLNTGPTALHTLMPQLATHPMPGASHWMHMDRPDEFNGILDDFLGQIDRQPGIVDA